MNNRKTKRKFFDEYGDIKNKRYKFFTDIDGGWIAISITVLSVLAAVTFDLLVSGELLSLELSAQGGCGNGQFYLVVSSLSSDVERYQLCFSSPLFEPKHFYWKLTVIILFLISARISYLMIAIKEERDDLKLEVKEQELADLIHTMPSQSIMEYFQSTYRKVVLYEDLYVKSLQAESIEFKQEAENLIRLCLDNIALLSKKYCRALDGDIFSTNIMTLHAVKDVKPEIKTIADFYANTKYDLDGNKYKNILVLRKDLSSSTRDGNTMTVDHTLPESFSLPVPFYSDSLKDFSVRLKSQFLAGAPQSLISDSSYAVITDTSKLDDIMHRYDLDEAVWLKVKEYFSSPKGRFIKSVLSIQLGGVYDSDVVGVLNIHSDQVDMFSKEAHVSPLVHLIEPFKLKMFEYIYMFKENIELEEDVNDK